MGLWRDKARGTWKYSFERKGKFYGGGGFKTKADARASREERRKEVAKIEKETPTDTAFSTVANKYLDWSEKRHVKQTYEYKAMVVREFMAQIPDTDIRNITPADLHTYLITRPSNHNYNVHRKELGALFTYAIRTLKLLNHSPVWDLEKLPVDKERKKIPTQEEFLRIIAAADPETEKPLILTLVHTWARIDELLRLRWEDVNFIQRWIILGTKKRTGGMEYDPMPMNEDLYEILWRLWENRKQDEWVFFNSKTKTRYTRRPKMMHAVCKRAGIKPIGTTTRRVRKKGKKVTVDQNVYYGFHTIRHFMASYAKDELKLGLGVISRLLRHKNLKTTEIYLHELPGVVVDAMKKQEGIFTGNPVAVSGCGFDRKEG